VNSARSPPAVVGVTSPTRDALAALSGALLTLSFPKFGHGAVAWVALLPLLLAIPGTRGLRAFRLGYVTGAVSAVGLLYWTALVVRQYGGLSFPVSVMVMMLLGLAFALFPSLFAWVLAGWIERFGVAALLLAPVAWVATELLRSHTLFRFAWCLLGYSQAGTPELIQLAAFGAVYAVSFVIACPAAALAYAWHEPRRPRRAAAAFGTLALVGLVYAHGRAVLARPLSAERPLRVGLVQASIRQDEKWDSRRLQQNFESHVSLTHEAAAAGARLVVWPESAVAWHYDDTPAVAEALRALTHDTGVHLVFGNDDSEPQATGRDRLYVGAKLIDPQGRLLLRYHKVRLVPFGEYVPLEPLLTLGGRVTARIVHAVSDFTPGDEATVGDALGRRLGVSICYEAIFPDFVRHFARNGAGLLLNITNDAWYGTTSAPHQHFAMAVFRAVENGRYLARAANTGISAFVDPRGRVLQKSALFERTVMVREVPDEAFDTFYSRHGDVFAWTCLGLAAALSLAARIRRSG
jgi:apolipoprotein N-acyltransferase